MTNQVTSKKASLRKRRARTGHAAFAQLMTSPGALILIAFSFVPFVYVIYTSMTNLDLLNFNRGADFVGLKNYATILQDGKFRQALTTTLYFTFLAVVLETVLGYALALFVNSLRFGQSTMRVILLLPMLCPPVTVTMVWQTMFSNAYGVLNRLLEVFGIAPVNWLQDVRVAFYAIVWVDVWQYMPMVFLLMYVGLRTIPDEMKEAASIDGANSFQTFRYIIFPQLLSTLGVVVLLRIIDAFRLFDKVNILTRGGPADSTKTITMYIYQTGIDQFRIGYASAGSVLMALAVLILASPYLRASFRKLKR